MNSSESKQRNNSASEKKKTTQRTQVECTKWCRIGGAPMRFKTQGELDAHMKTIHGER